MDNNTIYMPPQNGSNEDGELDEKIFNRNVKRLLDLIETSKDAGDMVAYCQALKYLTDSLQVYMEFLYVDDDD